jgi:hypothetical protein
MIPREIGLLHNVYRLHFKDTHEYTASVYCYAQLELSPWSDKGSVRKRACAVTAVTERSRDYYFPLLKVLTETLY